MMRLKAKFNIQVSSPCLLALPEAERPEVTASVGDFSVTARLLPVEGRRSKGRDDINWTAPLGELVIEVSRDELDPPPAMTTHDEPAELKAQWAYWNSKVDEYRNPAREVANRVLSFFQYSLFTPLVREITTWNQSLANPDWFDSHGNELRRGGRRYVVEPVPGLFGKLGARTLTPDDVPALAAFVATPSEPPLALALLSDAQSAWFEGSLRRAVLELAICAEIMVKRHFFAEATPAGAAFDYLEDKAKVSVRVMELVTSVAEEAFSRSYKKDEPTNFESIDHLFRCRNKIAHRGELSFRDDGGKTVAVDAQLVERWWHAVAGLKQWLESL